MERNAATDVSRTAEPSAPAFAVRVRPKFREVVLPPGPPPVPRGRGAAGGGGPPDATPDDPADPARPA
ncbi:hypothetical protein GCM10007886_47880 [Methylobacterium gregans]|uniref:Uncharacterized protein n=1 Tax=Methylobacterium gregans TaxID=374424 RepID=A0AA37HP01_9HYPH|nr:hypothetical protein [Methylobacterium gregans]MDQ0520590.1 hypothetical protein [Methylobacterium gregans]GJD79193.1 hypothetical protein NBEOAGPD_2414 [Methylobacterium gregans]GLS56603.1 hypothetical protein GCM10007886_47880 [Methylobacterium gregans]